MNQHIPFKRIALAGLGAVLMSAGASALADPPSRVARLAYVSGPVSFAPAGDNVWENASLNRPLIPGDRLWVEPGARDEIQLNGAALRMAGGTLVTLLNNDDRATQLQLSQGRLNVHVRRMRPNDVFEIDTPNLALSIREPGDYRIEVDPSGAATMVAVRRGQAEAYGDGNAYRLAAGQAYSFGGTDLRDARYARPMLDEFDRWSDARDLRIEQARSVRYVSPDLVGYEDLDDQGTWRVVPDYGNVWMPAHVGRDWAPYRDGHWSYVQPWGWTWIDDAPWGYAVSHYGRWARFNDGWGWVPGPRTASPVYAPALVAFVSIGSGSYAPRERPVAWFPLAPREVYRPSYRASPNYITNINVTNTAVDRRHIARDDRRADYANRRAVTAVPASAFAQAQPVSRSAIALPAVALAAAAIAHNAPVAPERERGHRGQGNQPPQAVMQRQVLARNAPPRAAFQAPMPQQQAPQAAVAPAPRVLPQDRRGARQFGQLPPQGSAPVVQQQPVAAQAIEREARRERGQRDADQRLRADQQAAIQQQAREQEQRGRMQQQEQQARMQQQAREQDERGRAQQQEQQARERQQRGRAQEQDQQARMQQQAREQEQRGRAQQQEQQARMQQQAREQEQRGRAQQQQEQQAREQEQRGRAQQQEAREQERMQQQAREQEQRGRAQQQAREQERMQQQAREQEQRGRAQQQQEQQARMQQQAHEQEQRGRAQQQAREQERMQQQAAREQEQAKARQAREQEQQARAQQQAHAQEQAKAQEHGRMQALAAQAAARAQAEQARAQAEQARAQAQAQAAQARAQAQQAPAQPAASAPPEKERGRGRGRDKQDEKDQQNR